MKRKFSTIVATLGVAAILATEACRDEIFVDDDLDEILLPIDSFSFAGTRWKLIGVVDNEMGLSYTPKPTDCEACYTMAFANDSMAAGMAVTNTLKVDFSKQPMFNVGSRTVRLGDEKLLAETIFPRMASFTVSRDYLKFYSGKKRVYIKFQKL